MLSTDTSHVENKEIHYWYGNLLQSVYLCFRSLRVQGLIQVKLDYYIELLNYTSDCLNRLLGKSNDQVFILRCFFILNNSISHTDIIVTPTTNHVCLSGRFAYQQITSS